MTTLILLFALTLVQAQKPATVEGTVLQFENGKPIPEAAVELSSIAGNGATKYTAPAAADGKFSFKDIPPGEYRLAATRPGYVRGEYGQRGPNGRGLVLSLADGAEVKDAKVVLAATGSIAGRIRDGNGAPMANVQVQALRYAYFNGQRTLAPVRAAITDDLGEYRLYWLPPQQYIVLAAPLRGEVGDEFISAAGANYTISNLLKSSIGKPIQIDSEPATPFFFPGVIDAQTASPVDVRPGADVRGIDMNLRMPKTFRISGKVTNRIAATPSGGPAPPSPPPQVRLVPGDVAFAETFGASLTGGVDTATGAFEIKGVPPGSYMLVTQAAAGYSFLRLDISRDMDDIALPITPAADVPVRVTIEGDTPGNERPELAQVRVQAIPSGGGRAQAATPVPQQPPGTFQWRGATPYTLRLGFANLPASAYVKSARLGPADVLQDGFVPDKTNTNPLEIILSLKGGVLSGTAVDARMQPLPNVTVALVPNAPRRERADLYKQASTNASGQFRISGIAPGDYKVFAWEDVPNTAWQHPEFIKAYETRGTPLHIEEGGSENRQVTAIPAGQ